MKRAVIEWFSHGHERRAKLFALLACGLFFAAAIGAVTADASVPRTTVDRERPAGNTLIGLQGYQDGGKVIEVSPAGEVVWEYDDGDDFFDVELLDDERVQLAVADELPDEECPEEYRNDGFRNCVRNSVRIVDRETKETRWEYAWFDAKLHAHELHDADHYRVDGEDRWVLVDMGNDRVFAVDRAGEIRWQWNATDTYERPPDMGPESDWTHMNDVDRLRPGVFQVSLRNFDTIVELHVAEDGSVEVRPVVGPNEYSVDSVHLLDQQHNPDRLADGHLLVADSEKDRVVELDAAGEVVWEYGGSAVFDWPRDADRLPNGHTLVTDSYNDRVVEVDERGEVVWAVETDRLPYEADRIAPNHAREGSSDRPTATDLPTRVEDAWRVERTLQWAHSMSKYVLPYPLGGQFFLLLGGVLALAASGVEGYRWRR